MNDFLINQTIAYNIRKLRRLSGMTQRDLASKAKVSSLTISRLETLRTKTTTKQLIDNLEDIFKVSRGYLTNTTIDGSVPYLIHTKQINKFCRICGTKLHDDSIYCHFCGTRIIL